MRHCEEPSSKAHTSSSAHGIYNALIASSCFLTNTTAAPLLRPIAPPLLHDSCAGRLPQQFIYVITAIKGPVRKTCCMSTCVVLHTCASLHPLIWTILNGGFCDVQYVIYHLRVIICSTGRLYGNVRPHRSGSNRTIHHFYWNVIWNPIRGR